MSEIMQGNEETAPGETGACCSPAGDSQPVCVSPPEVEAWCGSPPGPAIDPMERPGYRIWSFVEEFIDTEAGPVPKVGSRLDRSDILGGIGVRLGGARDSYRVAPGLYCVGRPGPDSVVLVTANYKLSFDALRKGLYGLDAWILVLDTRGINVWCAAGKKTFSTEEVVKRVQISGLEKLVRHRKLILPQFGATGVSARKVKKECGFQVIWGPVKARDLRQFVQAGMKADTSMRRVTFSIAERTVLVPVEVSHLIKPALWILLGLFLLSGIGPGIFSLGAAWSRGIVAAAALLAGIVAGAVVAPILLPWLPGVTFSLKGAVTGLIGGIIVVIVFRGSISGLGALALILFAASLSSYLTMNFTGSTPFTAPSGVEKEMRRAIPVQAATLLISIIAWVASAFGV